MSASSKSDAIVPVVSTSSSSVTSATSALQAAQSASVPGRELLIHQASGIQLRVHNVVATVTLRCPLNLKKIAMQVRNAEYNPKRFSAVVMRIRVPKVTALMFASGKMVVTGARSLQDASQASKMFTRILQKLQFPVKYSKFTVQNVLASCDCKFPIRLEGLSFHHIDFCTYEPELFPGLIYRMVEPKIVLLIFVSGKVVLTGGKNKEQLLDAFDKIYPTLLSFRKNNDS